MGFGGLCRVGDQRSLVHEVAGGLVRGAGVRGVGGGLF